MSNSSWSEFLSDAKKKSTFSVFLSCKEGTISFVRAVERFLAGLNEKKLVQGWAFSRTFRGSFLAYLGAVLSQSNEYGLHTFRPCEGYGGRNAMMNNDYKGMTVVIDTRVYRN